MVCLIIRIFLGEDEQTATVEEVDARTRLPKLVAGVTTNICVLPQAKAKARPLPIPLQPLPKSAWAAGARPPLKRARLE